MTMNKQDLYTCGDCFTTVLEEKPPNNCSKCDLAAVYINHKLLIRERLDLATRLSKATKIAKDMVGQYSLVTEGRWIPEDVLQDLLKALLNK
jgi:hypothetical protein